VSAHSGPTWLTLIPRAEVKRLEAKDRQASFEADVVRIAFEQNISPERARKIAARSRRFSRLKADRAVSK